jgi:type IX secretion system PorP/SprF family membrane protein
MKRQLLILSLLASFNINAQDIHFSQFYNAPLLQNPSLAGGTEKTEASILYRSQWKSITVPYKTFAANGSIRLQRSKNQKNYFGVGLSIFQDQSGEVQMSTINGSFNLAYHVKIARHHRLGLGIQTGFGQRKIDAGNYQWGSQYEGTAYNPNSPTGENILNQNIAYLDFAGGLVWTFDNKSGKMFVDRNEISKGNAGIAIFHFNRPDFSFNQTGEKLHIKYVAHANFTQSLGRSKFAMQPGFFTYFQGPNKQIFLGSMVRYDLLMESKYSKSVDNVGASMGAYWRLGDALVINSQFEVGNLALGLSYDANLSNLRKVTYGRGGFEISIRYINR